MQPKPTELTFSPVLPKTRYLTSGAAANDAAGPGKEEADGRATGMPAATTGKAIPDAKKTRRDDSDFMTLLLWDCRPGIPTTIQCIPDPGFPSHRGQHRIYIDPRPTQRTAAGNLSGFGFQRTAVQLAHANGSIPRQTGIQLGRPLRT
jgi:hypothetical protein